MFVQANTLKEIRTYFKQELGNQFSDNELKIIVKTLYKKRFGGDDTSFMFAQDDRLSESDLLYFHHALKRIRNQEPFQYVIGETEFYGLLLRIDHRALIPRPETEELVDWILNTASRNDSLQIADFCAGSGCIALALKSQLTHAKVFAVELSSEALALCAENKALTEQEIDLMQADVLLPMDVNLFDAKLDLIVSNPPYIPVRDKAMMAANVLDFEPEMALFVSDDDPLIFYSEIIANATRLLKENGWIYFEIHEDLGDEVKALFEAQQFVNIELRKDLQGRDRMVRAQMVSFAP